MNNKLENGDQLRIGIIDYSNAMATRVWQYVLLWFLFPSISIYLFVTDIHFVLKFIFAFVDLICLMMAFSFLFINAHTKYGYIHYNQVVRLLNESIVSFNVNDEYKYLVLEFFVPSKKLIDRNEESEKLIFDIVKVLLPQYPFDKYTFYSEMYAMPSISLRTENSIMDELERLVDSDLDNNSSNLPTDIKTKGKEMSRAYLTLYCIENTLRLFIESESKKMLQPLVIPNSVRNKITGRKANESQNKYISVRGASDLFYMDFKELGDVIVNNPELKNRFPDENWVRVKIDELGNVRNLIAHNSYIGEHELKIISTNYESILRQIRK